MWGEIPLFEATRSIYYSSRYSNSICKKPILSNRSKQQLNDIRRMRVDLADSNRRIGDRIFLNTEKERRRRLFQDIYLQSILKSTKPTRLPTCDFVGRKSNMISCSSDGAVFERSFDLQDNSYDNSSFSNESSDTSSYDLLGQSRQKSDDSSSSQTSDDSSFELFDDESVFELIGNFPNTDVIALIDMLNNIFGHDKIYQHPTRKFSSTSSPHITCQDRALQNSMGLMYGAEAPPSTSHTRNNGEAHGKSVFSANANFSANMNAQKLSSNIVENSKCSRQSSEPVSVGKVRKRGGFSRESSFERKASNSSQKESINLDDISPCTNSKRIDRRDVVGKILDTVMNDVESSRERLN